VEDSQYFVDNATVPEGDVQFPGMTVTLTAYAQVQCGQEYHIKLAIGDASDGALDSGVFLEAGSFTSNSVVQVNLDIPVGVNDSTLYEGCGEALLQFIRPLSSSGIEETAYLEVSGSALNGIDFVPALPDSVIFPVGVDTVTFILTAPTDVNFEGQEFVTVTITNIASNCSGAVLTSDFTFYVNEEDPLEVTGFDAALVDCNDEVDLFPTVTGGYGEYSYQWSTGSTADTITVSPGFTTTFFLVVSDTCGLPSVQTSFDVTVPTYPPILVDLGEDFVVNECDVTIDLNAVVTGGFGTYDYAWLENNTLLGTLPNLNYFVASSTNIELIVTDDCGATGQDDINITVPPVEVTALLPDVFVANSCLEEIMLPAISDGGIGTKIFRWFVDNELQAETTLPYFMYHPSMGQNVVIVAEDECENSASDSTFIPFNFPEVTLRLSPDTAICEGTQAVVYAEPMNGSGNFDVRWQGADKDTTHFLVEPELSRTYTVIATDTCGMQAQGTVRVEVREVWADFDYQYVDYYGLKLTDYSRAVNPTFFWDFGDGNTSIEQNPTHLYTSIDPFRVVLTVTDDIGCRDTAQLRTIPPIEIFIPNSFTPNGDGINDLWGAEATNLYEFELWIYDRWGNQVFHTTDISKKWNGSTNGGEYFANATWYSYFIRYKGKKEEDAVERTGIITIVR
jgi:gliding motility-associated-like protein